MRECHRCHAQKELSGFNKDSGSPDGLFRWCRECQHEHSRAYHAAHRESENQKSSAYRESHLDKYKEYQKQHHEEAVKYRVKYENNNRDKINQRTREKRKLLGNLYRENAVRTVNKRRAEYNAMRRSWRLKNKESVTTYESNRRARKKGNGGKHTKSQWLELLKICGNKCLACGGQIKICRDHILPVIQGGTSNIWNIQPLCTPCNVRKSGKYIDYRPEFLKRLYSVPATLQLK